MGKPERGTHHAHLYDFSLAPWRVAELLWPNVSGHMFPVNQRWLSALGGEDRVWTPTLYLGIMPLLIALTTWRLRTADPHVRWLSLVAVGALIGSFGWYGLGWLASEIQGAWTGSPPTFAVGAPTGGLYWLMVKLLPGYAYFRYPAKLLVIAALAVALLAGAGFPHAVTTGRRQTCRSLAVLAGGSMLAAIAFAACGPWWADWFAGAAPDELFGPLDAQRSVAWRNHGLSAHHRIVQCLLVDAATLPMVSLSPGPCDRSGDGGRDRVGQRSTCRNGTRSSDECGHGPGCGEHVRNRNQPRAISSDSIVRRGGVGYHRSGAGRPTPIVSNKRCGGTGQPCSPSTTCSVPTGPCSR